VQQKLGHIGEIVGTATRLAGSLLGRHQKNRMAGGVGLVMRLHTRHHSLVGVGGHPGTALACGDVHLVVHDYPPLSGAREPSRCLLGYLAIIAGREQNVERSVNVPTHRLAPSERIAWTGGNVPSYEYSAP
jgi:hypothetical protein